MTTTAAKAAHKVEALTPLSPNAGVMTSSVIRPSTTVPNTVAPENRKAAATEMTIGAG